MLVKIPRTPLIAKIPRHAYSLHPLLIAIFQNFKCSKMIAIFAIGMGCDNK
jgi:hypothetical protein